MASAAEEVAEASDAVDDLPSPAKRPHNSYRDTAVTGHNRTLLSGLLS